MNPGADYRGQLLSLVSFQDADLAGARFEHARLELVDLSRANLRGARFDGASLRHVIAVQTVFAGVVARGAFFEHVDFSGADLGRTDLRGAIITESTLHRADFSQADLTEAKIVHCDAARADLRGAFLRGAITPWSTFEDAKLEGAAQFSTCRELVVEVLRREIDGDLERASAVGAVAIQRSWCYEEWAQVLRSAPHLREVATEVFARYPRSGINAALTLASRQTARC